MMKEKEYGGYIELDTYGGREYYPELLALNSGRTALRFLLQCRKIKKLWIPSLCCSTVWEACEKEGVPWETYPVDIHFLPVLDRGLEEGEWLYLVNFYGVLPDARLQGYARTYPRLIVDHVHAFFQAPPGTADTIYSCRKFFGVPDGAYLSMGIKKGPAQTFCPDWQAFYDGLPQDVSHDRMGFLLGRFEGNASAYHKDYAKNNEIFTEEPVKRMSALTHNLLRAIDYPFVAERRSENFRYLHARLERENRLELPFVEGAYAYPFWYLEATPSGPRLRKKLLEKKIYIPTLWPEMLKTGQEDTLCYQMAENILPLPVDQRYTTADMDVICDALLEAL